MNKSIANKTIILNVLKFLKRTSSKETPVTYTQIAHVLNSLNIPCDRKTVSRNIQYLIEFGYDIVTLPKGGCYYQSPLPKEDLALLTDFIHCNFIKFKNKKILDLLEEI